MRSSVVAAFSVAAVFLVSFSGCASNQIAELSRENEHLGKELNAERDKRIAFEEALTDARAKNDNLAAQISELSSTIADMSGSDAGLMKRAYDALESGEYSTAKSVSRELVLRFPKSDLVSSATQVFTMAEELERIEGIASISPSMATEATLDELLGAENALQTYLGEEHAEEFLLIAREKLEMVQGEIAPYRVIANIVSTGVEKTGLQIVESSVNWEHFKVADYGYNSTQYPAPVCILAFKNISNENLRGSLVSGVGVSIDFIEDYWGNAIIVGKGHATLVAPGGSLAPGYSKRVIIVPGNYSEYPYGQRQLIGEVRINGIPSTLVVVDIPTSVSH